MNEEAYFEMIFQVIADWFNETTTTEELDNRNHRRKEVVIYDCGKNEYYSHFSIQFRKSKAQNQKEGKNHV